jgi:DNA-binding NarL/FixJ family response regulator
MPGAALHGRRSELEAIEATLDDVARGAQRLLLVRGEAGIGKTRLLKALTQRAAAQRFVVLEGRASEFEQYIPLVPILDAFEPRLPHGELLATLGDDRLSRLAGVFPAIAAAPVADGERWRLHRALGDLLALIAAGRPLLLMIDDVHWADPATAELLEHLVRRPPAESLLIAAGARPGRAADTLLAAQRAAGRVDGVALDVTPLARADADALLDTLAAGVDRDAVYARSGGNPLLLAELARAGDPDVVPAGIVSALGAELDALPAEARALAQAAAVAGDPFALDLAARIASLDDGATLAALDTLAEQELVHPTREPRQFRFRHPVVRSAVYATLGPGARLTAHATAARALEAAGAPLVICAQHLAHAASSGDAAGATTLRRAAAQVRASSPVVAADWLLAAQRADPGGTDVAELATTLVEAGRLELALEVLDSVDSPAVALPAAGIERLLGHHAAATRRLRRALDSAVPGSPEAARVRADLAVAAYQRGDYAEMRDWVAGLGDAIEDTVVRAAAATLGACGDALDGRPGGAAEEAAALVAAAGDAELGAAAELAMAISWGLLALDRLEDGLAAARRIAAAARGCGNSIAAIPHDLAATLALGLLGRMPEAQRLADETEQAARVSGNAALSQWALWLHAWVLMERGELDAALAAANESVTLAGALDDSASAMVADVVLGAVLGARGAHERARPLLAAYNVDNGWICRWAPVLVESDLALGDSDAAHAHAERAAALAPGTGMAGARAAAARAQALVALAAGDAQAAVALALSAAVDADAAGAQLEAARDRLVAGRALTGPAAIEQLRAAREQATRCGAPRVEDEARRALRRAGARSGRSGPRAPEGAGLHALTTREHEIAMLVADGLTNRQIGARIFLSEKTVETHLSHVFTKLGVRSRTQVATLIARRAMQQ